MNEVNYDYSFSDMSRSTVRENHDRNVDDTVNVRDSVTEPAPRRMANGGNPVIRRNGKPSIPRLGLSNKLPAFPLSDDLPSDAEAPPDADVTPATDAVPDAAPDTSATPDADASPVSIETDTTTSRPLRQVVQTFYTPIYVLTGIFGAIFIIGPLLVRRGENQGVIRASIMLSVFCMWIFWVTVYIAQMNPLVGPNVKNTTLAWIAYSWGNVAKELPPGFYNKKY